MDLHHSMEPVMLVLYLNAQFAAPIMFAINVLQDFKAILTAPSSAILLTVNHAQQTILVKIVRLDLPTSIILVLLAI